MISENSTQRHPAVHDISCQSGYLLSVSLIVTSPYTSTRNDGVKSSCIAHKLGLNIVIYK